MITLTSNCLIYYVLIGYIMAFNTCCKFEYENKLSLGLFNTGIVTLVFVLFWPIIALLNMLFKTLVCIQWKMHENEEVKGEK